jgi:hypothetical protein
VPPWVSCPFSAIIIRRDKRNSTPVASRPQVFPTSRQDSVRNDSRVCSTPLALLGFDLQRLTLDRSELVPELPGSFAVTRPSWLPFGEPEQFPLRGRPGSTRLRPRLPDPSSPCSDRLPSWARADLGALIPIESASFTVGFHPNDATAPLLAFLSLRVSFTGCPGHKALPFWGLPPLEGSSAAGDGFPE